jgi:hypothetical protein
MYADLAGLVTVFDARGEQLDQGAMMRYLCEIVWFPIAFLGDNISWRTIDGHSAEIRFSDAGKEVSGRLFFDEDGRPTNLTAKRYRETGGDFSLGSWSAPIAGYGVRAGLQLPTPTVKLSGFFRPATSVMSIWRSKR